MLDKVDGKHKLFLIDFGSSTKFLNSSNEHIRYGLQSKFFGTIIFTSKNTLMKKVTSRRDDIIALAYTLSYLIDPY